jgi:hypothetical protein
VRTAWHEHGGVKGFPAGPHIAKPPDPDESIGIVEIAEGADHVSTERVLRLNERALEQRDQCVALPPVERVLTQHEHTVRAHRFLPCPARAAAAAECRADSPREKRPSVPVRHHSPVPLRLSSSCSSVSVTITFTSQVLPPSTENACSKRHEVAVMTDTSNRTRIVLPLYAS